MKVTWTLATIFSPDLDSEEIRTEDLYLTILVHTEVAMRSAGKIREICSAMHLVDTDEPPPFATRCWTGPSINQGATIAAQLSAKEQLSLHAQVNSVMDANRIDKDSGHGKTIIIPCEKSQVGYRYAIRLAELYQQKTGNMPEAAQEYHPGETVDNINAGNRVMYARGAFFADAEVNPANLVRVTQPVNTQIGGRGRVTKHDWLLIVITKSTTDWLRDIAKNISSESLREEYVDMYISNIYRELEQVMAEEEKELDDEEYEERL